MAFIENTTGVTYNPGYFLADAENCTRVTKNFKKEGNGGYTVKDGANGGKYVPMGTVYKESSTAVGIVYEDVDVTNGEAAGSVVIAGTVYEDRLPAELNGDEESLKNIKVIKSSPKIERPGDEAV